MTADLLPKARAGDADAFRQLTEPHRKELQVHCYRMLGSFHDAEDALQDSLLAAWQGFEQFEARSSLRTWLYKVATNRCLNARRSAKRRPAKAYDVPGVHLPEPTRLGRVVSATRAPRSRSRAPAPGRCRTMKRAAFWPAGCIPRHIWQTLPRRGASDGVRSTRGSGSCFILTGI